MLVCLLLAERFPDRSAALELALPRGFRVTTRVGKGRGQLESIARAERLAPEVIDRYADDDRIPHSPLVDLAGDALVRHGHFIADAKVDLYRRAVFEVDLPDKTV